MISYVMILYSKVNCTDAVLYYGMQDLTFF
uniref:Uncharacterized protein n=1 Tax=Arundo donax TaxID=35708 RepID=A0A0A9CKH7_ARUDO